MRTWGKWVVSAAAMVLVSCASPTERPEDLMNVTTKSNIYSNPRSAQTDQQLSCAVNIDTALRYIHRQPTYGICRALIAKAYEACASIYDSVGRRWVTDLTNNEVRLRGADQFCGNWYVIRK